MENRSQVQNGEMEIDLKEVFMVLMAKLPLMIAVGLCTAMLMFLYSGFVAKPTYESSTKIYILNKQDNTNVTFSDIQMGTQLTKDYAELIKSRFVLESVIEQLGLPMSYEGLNASVSVRRRRIPALSQSRLRMEARCALCVSQIRYGRRHRCISAM